MSNPLSTYEQNNHPVAPLAEESTILPKPLAGAVSLATRSGAVYLRLGTLIGRLALDAGRVTTLTSLEISRTVLERVLFRAGDDIHKRSTGELGRQEAEGVLERSINALHSTITSISFAAATGFHIGTAGLSAGSEAALALLGTLDSVLGSTDSSRAIASIISLVKREFDNPATGQPGETVSVKDLLAGMTGLALLQKWCKIASDQEAIKGSFKEVVWDVVILDDGRRADVAESFQTGLDMPEEGSRMRNGPDGPAHSDDIQGLRLQGMGDEDGLKDRIMEYLPADATVSITAETTTTKTITVEVTGAEPPDLPVPSGAEVIEEHAHFGAETTMGGQAATIPYYKVVYRTTHSSTRGTDVAAIGEPAEEMRQTSIMDFAPAARDEMDIGITSPESEDSFLFRGLSSPSREDSARFKELPDAPAEESFVEVEAPKQRPEPSRFASEASISRPTSHQSNSKRVRQPLSTGSLTASSGSETPTPKSPQSSRLLQKKAKTESHGEKEKVRKGGLMSAIRKGPQATFSNIMGKEQASGSGVKGPTVEHLRPAWGIAVPSRESEPKKSLQLSPERTRGQSPSKRQGLRPSALPKFSRQTSYNKELPRPPSQAASFYEVHESRRDSMVSRTDTYSVHSGPSTRASSPTDVRHVRTKSTQSSLLRTRSEKNIDLNLNLRPNTLYRQHSQPSSPGLTHRSKMSYDPSIYTLRTSASQTSLVLKRHERGQYDDAEGVRMLQRSGSIPGLFPQHHFVRNITRFIRFSSASYGSNFMRLMGISATPTGGEKIPDPSHHYEHHSFGAHTQLPSSTILLSSFVDPQGGTDKSGRTDTNVPLVHFISLDHDSKAVVLSCRGTLGFEDVLTDMTCDYDDMPLNGRTYRVHKGIYASARRLLSGQGCRVVATLAAALEEFPSYGLVMCGHSLGGGVVSLLAIMLSTPGNDPESCAFVTAAPSSYPSSPLLLTGSPGEGTAPPPPITLPSGRPIHVYAYGPPATVSQSLRLATRGLITTIVNGTDLVPSLSLGTLHDLQAVALAFKTDSSGASGRVRARVWESLRSGLMEQWYRGDYNDSRGHYGGERRREEDEIWAWATLKTLRAGMQGEKLVPPGECFQVETSRVLQRDAFVNREGGRGLGRPATRVVLRFVREVEKVFGEVQFSSGMLTDHSPGRYENALKALGSGVLDGYR